MRTCSNWFKCVAFALCLTFTSVDVAAARAGGTTLEGITAAADVIVVAKVESIVNVGAKNGSRGTRVAVAKVVHPLKSVLKVGDEVAFLAQPTWACDLSGAVLDETVLLFLRKPNEKLLDLVIPNYGTFQADLKQRLPAVPFFQIAHHGGGRIEVLQQDKVDYLVMAAEYGATKINARVHTSYIYDWPKNFTVLAHPDAKETQLRLVPLAEVEAAIVTIMLTPEAAETDGR